MAKWRRQAPEGQRLGNPCTQTCSVRAQTKAREVASVRNLIQETATHAWGTRVPLGAGDSRSGAGGVAASAVAFRGPGCRPVLVSPIPRSLSRHLADAYMPAKGGCSTRLCSSMMRLHGLHGSATWRSCSTGGVLLAGWLMRRPFVPAYVPVASWSPRLALLARGLARLTLDVALSEVPGWAAGRVALLTPGHARASAAHPWYR